MTSRFLYLPAPFENISKLSQDSQSNFKYNCEGNEEKFPKILIGLCLSPPPWARGEKKQKKEEPQRFACLARRLRRASASEDEKICNKYTVNVFQVIYQTRESVFHQIFKHWEVGWKNEAQPSFFKRVRGVWISDETRFRVFDMASQMSNNYWRNSRLKLAKFYGN